MQTLAIFPELLSFGFFAPMLLRIFVAIFLFYIGIQRWNKPLKGAVLVYFIGGAFLILGLYTQPAAILGILLIKFDFFMDRKPFPVSKDRLMMFVLAAVILLTLLVTGPGAFAFDYPL